RQQWAGPSLLHSSRLDSGKRSLVNAPDKKRSLRLDAGKHCTKPSHMFGSMLRPVCLDVNSSSLLVAPLSVIGLIGRFAPVSAVSTSGRRTLLRAPIAYYVLLLLQVFQPLLDLIYESNI